ncbi:hypothetical protein VSR34_31830 [Paraburkholderia sp. JHI2823]|nr:hypothetical protein [Paraburkholderia mimosarum]
MIARGSQEHGRWGTALYDARDSKTFGGQLDRFLARHAAHRKGD